MSDSDASTAALVARLAEEDDSLLEHPSPLAQAMLVERLYQYSWPTRYLPYFVLLAGFIAFRDETSWIEICIVVLIYTLGTWWLDRQRFGFAEDPLRQKHAPYWAQRFSIGSGATGAAWGVFFWLYGTTQDSGQQAMLCLMWSGLAFSNMTTRSPHLLSYYAFFLTMSAPLFARALLNGGKIEYMMALLGVALGAAFSMRAHAGNRAERLAIGLRLRNAELIAEIDRARAEASAAHVAAEQALAARAASFNSAERLAGFGSWEWRLDEGHLHWSDNMFRMLDLAPATAPADKSVLLECAHPADRPSLDAFFAALAQQGRAQSVDFRVNDGQTPEGRPQWRPLRLIGIVQRDSTGRIVKLLGALRDMRDPDTIKLPQKP